MLIVVVNTSIANINKDKNTSINDYANTANINKDKNINNIFINIFISKISRNTKK